MAPVVIFPPGEHCMIIKRTIRVGKDVKFNPGQEQALLDHAAAFPEQLDFLWLLKSGVIDEVPVVESLTPAQREERQAQIEQEQADKIEAANKEAEARRQKEQEEIDEARRREVEKADKRRAAEERVRKEQAGEGAE